MESPEASLLQAIIERLKLKVPELRYISQDIGQLDTYEIRPAVAWPCCLIDIEDFDYSEQGNDPIQLAGGSVQIRVGCVQLTQVNNLTAENVREMGLNFYEVENKVYKALHFWNPGGFSKLLRRKSGTERRQDDIRVRRSKYAISFTDTSALPVKQTIPRPDPKLGTDVTIS